MIRRTWICVTFLLLTSLSVVAQVADLSTPLDEPQAEIVRLTIKGSVAGDVVSGIVRATIDPEWHINSAKPLDDFAIPTTLTISSDAFAVEEVTYPPHVERAFTFAGGSKVAVYEREAAFPFRASKSNDRGTAEIKLHYQACNDRVCLPPRDAVLQVKWDAKKGFVDSDAGAASVVAPLSQAGGTESASAPLFGPNIGATLASRGLLLTLLVVFVVGIALNLTPCVYPLIPITLGFFASQTDGRKGRMAGLAGTFVLGIALMYSTLGVFSALSGKLFGAWLQSPVVLIFFALLMLVMAVSMFGAFEIRMPHFIADRAGARSGYPGALSMGLLAGIVAAPCVGPVVISLIAVVSETRNPWLGFILFFVLALGLGLPYLVLGISSAAIPRSGPWMVQVKKAMGFILIAMAFYFLRPVAGDLVFKYGVAASLIVGAAFLLLRRDPTHIGNVIRLTAAVILLVAGVAFAWPRPDRSSIPWKKYDTAALAEAKAAGKPVIIDFYADWCLPCKELDKYTFSDPKVIDESNRFVTLKADLTKSGDPDVQKLSDEYSVVGVPSIVFLDSSGREMKDLRLTGFEPPEKFLKRVAAVQ